MLGNLYIDIRVIHYYFYFNFCLLFYAFNMGKQVFMQDMYFFPLVPWASEFFFSICQPLLSLLSYILFHETEYTGIFGKTLLGYVFCCK